MKQVLIMIYTILIMVFIFTPLCIIAIIIDSILIKYNEKLIKQKELKEWEI
jgi:hypothetical protein